MTKTVVQPGAQARSLNIALWPTLTLIASFSTAGAFSWTVPADITAIVVIGVGGGGGGGGGLGDAESAGG